MEWLHCNNCYQLPGTGKRFFLTSCGHIYCIDCQPLCCSNGVCKLCGNQCSTIPLSSKMKPDVEMYFIEPLELLKKYLAQVHQAAEFQNNHRARLMEYYKEQVVKQRRLKDEFKCLMKKAKECDNERQRLKKENYYFRQLLTKPQYEMPGNQSGSALNFESPIHSQNNKGFSSSLNDYHLSAVVSQRSMSGVNDILSPADSASNHILHPARVSVRQPPVNGKMGSVTGTTPTSALTIGNLRRHNSHQGVSSIYFTPELQVSQSHSSDGNRNSESFGLRNLKDIQLKVGREASYMPDERSRSLSRLATRIRSATDIKKIAVHPYSPCEDS